MDEPTPKPPATRPPDWVLENIRKELEQQTIAMCQRPGCAESEAMHYPRAATYYSDEEFVDSLRERSPFPCMNCGCPDFIGQ